MTSVKNKLEQINTFLGNSGRATIDNDSLDEKTIDILFELYIKNNVPTLQENTDANILFHIGKYYHILGNDVNTKKYYLLAIEKGNPTAMNNLGIYYYKRKDYGNMKEYYLMAIEKGNVASMYNLGVYYEDQKDYENMKQYYLMAVEKGHNDAIHNLGTYYCNHGDYACFINLYRLIKNNKQEEALNSIMLSAIRKRNDLFGKLFYKLIQEYRYLIEQHAKLEKSNKCMEERITELEHRPPNLGGPKYEEAKKNFVSIKENAFETIN